MRKFPTIIFLTILIMSIASSLIAGAQESTTANNTNSTTSTPIGTESKEQTFRVGPTVSLRPLNSEIDKSQNGIVELFLNNPSLNDCTLEVDVEVSVPSDIYIYAEDGSLSGGAGTVTGHMFR